MDQVPVQRSRFLTVLCTLSFINGGLNVFLNLPSLLSQGDRQPYDEPLPPPDSPPPSPLVAELMNDMTNIMEHIAQHYTIIVLSTIILAGMSLMGVWMMWNLKKAGFLFYTTAQVLWAVMPLVLLGSSTLLYLAAGLSSLLTITFVIMYGTQLKQMS